MAAIQTSISRHLRKLVGTQHIGQFPDQDLVERFAAAHDHAAFEVLVQRHGVMVLHLCRRLLRHTQDAEDAFQATFLVLARRARSIHKRESVSSWLYGVAYRITREAIRESQRRRAREKVAADRVPADPAADMTWREAGQVLDEELARLPDRYRAPLVLCFLEGKTQDEAARHLGWSLGTFRRRLDLGRNILRGRLTRRGVTLAAGLWVTGLLPSTASALVPAALAARTIEMSLIFALKETMTPVAVSAQAAAWAQKAIKSAIAFKIKIGLAIALALTSFVTGAALVVQQTIPAKAGGDPKSSAKAAAPSKPMVEKQGRPDLYGDPLPDGAVARMGSIRLRHASLSDFRLLAGGKTIISTGTDGLLRTWEMASGRQMGVVKLGGEEGRGPRTTLSSDGKTLAGFANGKHILWSVASGKLIKTLPFAESSEPFFYRFAPDGKTLAFWSLQARVTLWEWATGKQRQLALPARKNAMDSTFHDSFSPDGKWFVVGGGWGENLCVFELASGRLAHRLDCDASISAFSPDSKRLAVPSMKNDRGERDMILRLFDLGSGKEVAQFRLGGVNPYYSLAFSPNGKTIACAKSDGGVLLDSTTGRVLHRLAGGWPCALRFSADGKTLVAGVAHRLRLWEVGSGKEQHNRPGDFGYEAALAVSPDGRLLAEADWTDKSVSLWDTKSGRLLRQLPLKEENRYVRNLWFSSDGRTLVTTQYKGILQSWDVATGKDQRAVQLHNPSIPNPDLHYYFQLYVARDGKHVSTLERPLIGPMETRRLARWDIPTGKLIHQHSLPPDARACAWSSDGSTVALALSDGLALMDVLTGAVKFRVPGTATDGAPALSPDDRLLAVRHSAGPGPTSVPAKVSVWEVVTGKEVARLATGRVDHLALAPGSRALVTTDTEFLRVWDLASGKERRRWPLPLTGTRGQGKSFVYRLLLSPDARRAFTALADGTALVWDLSPALHLTAPVARRPGTKEMAGWWADLAGDDAARAFQARAALTAVPEPSVCWLKDHLRTAAVPNPSRLAELLADLDSPRFAARQKAMRELQTLGELARHALKHLLEKKPSPEVRQRVEKLLRKPKDLTPDQLRGIRAIEVLERIATTQARSLLEALAKGLPEARLTEEANAALKRLGAPR